MPPSDVSLKRRRKVPEMVFFSSLRSLLRLTKPMMRLKHRKAAVRPTRLPALPLSLSGERGASFWPSLSAKSLHLTDRIHLPGLEEVQGFREVT